MTAAQAFRWQSACRSEVGNVRKINEDAFLDSPARGLWFVADGMGGHDAGDVASRTVVDLLGYVGAHDRFGDLVDEVEDRVLDANRRLYSMARETAQIIGSTLAGVLAHGAHCVSVWAGDSRVYRLRGGKLERITRDHSQVEEMLERGELDAASAAGHHSQNVITRAVGGDANLFLDYALSRIEDRDRFLVCSDGLYKELSAAELAELLSGGTCVDASDALLETALARECSDNVTAIVIDFSALKH